MDLGRMLRHMMLPHWTVRRAFPADALRTIEDATRQSETRHSGQVRFAVESSLDVHSLLHGESPQERAQEVFSRLRVWDTAENNGVLIYLLLADRHVEILADRGVHGRVGAAGWDAICRRMESAFRDGRFAAGVVDGIEAVTEVLAREYPASEARSNELPDQPAILN